MAKKNTRTDTKSPLPTRRRIVDAATELFLRDGFAATNLESVADYAGVTKPTIYSHFGSKANLLLAVTEAHASENAQLLTAELTSGGDTRAALMAFAKVFLNRVQSEQAARWHRLALTESTNHPEIGDAIYQAGPARVIAELRKFMKLESTAGRLSCDDPAVAAEQFLGLLSGVNPIRMMTGQSMPTTARQTKFQRQAVDTFLRAFGGTSS